MNTQQLQTFVMLAETLNYHHAADKLQYSPSTLFKHIKLLEEEVGAVLLRKKGRNLELTAAGHRMIQPAKKILRYVEDTIQLVQTDAEAVMLRIAGSPLNTDYAVCDLLRAFAEQNPSIQILHVPTDDVSARSLIWQKEADLAFCYEVELTQTPNQQTLPLYQEPVCLLCNPDYPLAQQHNLDWYDLEGIPVVDSSDTHPFVTALNRTLTDQGIDTTPVIVDGNLQDAVHHVCQNNSLLAVPWTAVPRLQAEHGLLPLDLIGEPVRIQLVLIAPESLIPEAEAFLQFTRDFADKAIAQAPNSELSAAKTE